MDEGDETHSERDGYTIRAKVAGKGKTGEDYHERREDVATARR